MMSQFQRPVGKKPVEPAPDPVTFQPFQRYRGRDEINKQALQRPDQMTINPVRPPISVQGPSPVGGTPIPAQHSTGALLPGQTPPASLTVQPPANDAVAAEEEAKMNAIKAAIAARNGQVAPQQNRYSLVNSFRPVG